MDPVGWSKAELESGSAFHPLGAGGRKVARLSDVGMVKPIPSEALIRFISNTAATKNPFCR
jgi:hypothetical protein